MSSNRNPNVAGYACTVQQLACGLAVGHVSAPALTPLALRLVRQVETSQLVGAKNLSPMPSGEALRGKKSRGKKVKYTLPLGQTYTLDEIAQALGISKARVLQIEQGVLRKLRRGLEQLSADTELET